MRNIRNTVKRPKMPWNSTQIKEDRTLMRQYGLRRKKELWKAQGELRIYRGRARKLISANDEKNYVLNESAIRRMGYEGDPIGRMFDMWGREGKIIGVVKDFHF